MIKYIFVKPVMWTHPNKKTPEFPNNNNALSDNESYKTTLVCYKHINRQTNGTEQIQKYTSIQRIKKTYQVNVSNQWRKNEILFFKRSLI